MSTALQSKPVRAAAPKVIVELDLRDAKALVDGSVTMFARAAVARALGRQQTEEAHG